MATNKDFGTFFDDLRKADVQREIDFLKANLPQKATKKNYQLTIEMLDGNVGEHLGLQSQLQRVANKMCEHLMIRRQIKVITMSNVDAGKFEILDNLVCIYINNDLRLQRFEQKVAILSHEMCHYYLMHHHNIVKQGEKENELLTEVGAVFIGFGFFLLDGYEPHETNVIDKSGSLRPRETTVGYIKPKLVYEAIIKTAYARKQKPQWLVRKIDLRYRFLALFRLFVLRIDYAKAKLARRKKLKDEK